MRAAQLIEAYADLAAVLTEHEAMEQAAKHAGIDPDEFLSFGAIVGELLHGTITETKYWPCETATDEKVVLALAFKLGILAALRAVEREAVS